MLADNGVLRVLGSLDPCTNAKMLKVISAFTAGPYEAEAEELVRSALNLTMPLETYEYGPFASWREAVAAKPDFIAQKLAALPEQFDGLLWLDADARMRREPDWKIGRASCRERV